MLYYRAMSVLCLFTLLIGCATMGDEVESAMIPPSANYSPIQAPVYPPLKDPYTPNMLSDNTNNKIMNIDRLNVGEANIPNLAPVQEHVDNSNNNHSMDIYIRDQRNDFGNNLNQNYTPSHSTNNITPYSGNLPENITLQQDVQREPLMIPNSPVLTPNNIIELSAIGMGVAPESTISPSQALALAKRAAIIDAYRQIGEKMYGVRLNANDTVRDMVLVNSIVKTKVEALIKNAEITETVYKDGLCQITMELKLDGKVWHKILSNTTGS